MGRRELLVAMLQAFFLALFPWLRTERGVEALGAALDRALPPSAAVHFGGWKWTTKIVGYELTEEQFRQSAGAVTSEEGSDLEEGTPCA